MRQRGTPRTANLSTPSTPPPPPSPNTQSDLCRLGSRRWSSHYLIQRISSLPRIRTNRSISPISHPQRSTPRLTSFNPNPVTPHETHLLPPPPATQLHDPLHTITWRGIMQRCQPVCPVVEGGHVGAAFWDLIVIFIVVRRRGGGERRFGGRFEPIHPGKHSHTHRVSDQMSCGNQYTRWFDLVEGRRSYRSTIEGLTVPPTNPPPPSSHNSPAHKR